MKQILVLFVINYGIGYGVKWLGRRPNNMDGIYWFETLKVVDISPCDK